MLTAHRYCPGGSLLVLLVLACSGSELVEPVDHAAPLVASGPKVKAPSNVTAVAISVSQVNLSWQDNSTNETGFEAYRSTTGASGTFVFQASTGAGITSHIDEGLTSSTQYCYQVRAFRQAGGKTNYSSFSTAVCATTLTPPVPPAPSAADATPSSSTVVHVGWTDNSLNEDGFRVERSVDGGTNWATAGSTDANIGSFWEGGRTPDQQVCYRVVALNNLGESPPSNMDCTAPPAAPTNLTVTLVPATGEADFAWVDNSTVEDGYNLFGYDEWGSYTFFTSLPANSTSFRTWPGNGSFIVEATNDGGLSDASGIAYLDCGGSECPSYCSGDFDCAPDQVCGPSGLCVAHCGDGIQNRDESDVDCAGSCDVRCAAGQHCWLDGDCASGICGGYICQP